MIANEHTEGRVFMSLCMGAWILVLTIALVAAVLIPDWDAGLAIFTIAAHVLGVVGGVIIGMVLAPRKVVLRDGSCTVKTPDNPNNVAWYAPDPDRPHHWIISRDNPFTVTPYVRYQSREIVKR